MAYRFRRGESPDEGLARIALEQFDRALDALTAGTPDVHDARKCCKRLRALLRLARPGLPADVYERENAAIRDAAREISGLRDAEALIEAFDALAGEDSADADRAALRRRLGGDRSPAAPVAAAVRDAEERLRQARTRVGQWRLDDDGFEPLGDGLRRTYRAGRRRLAEARDTASTPALHEWRKQVKYHWYHVRLLQPAWPGPLRARRAELKALSDALGDDHDLAMLDAALAAAPAAELGGLREALAQRRARLQAEAFALGARLYADRPKALRRRYRGYWEAWKRHG